MKYIFVSFFLLTLASCSLSNPLGEKVRKDEVPEIRVEGVQISDSGVSVSDESGNVSVRASGDLRIDMLPESDTDSASVGINGTGSEEKDPEVQKIQQDIDAIFSDIMGPEGK